MKNNLLIVAFLLLSKLIFAQPPCGTNPPAGETCATATPICELNGYCGNTTSYTADAYGAAGALLGCGFLGLGPCPGTGILGSFCGSVENDSYLSFVASSTSISIDVWITSSSQGDGIQLMIFETPVCGDDALTSFYCDQIAPNGGAPTNVSATGLVAGNTYFIMIDGFAGDQVEYVIGANTGVQIPVAVTPATSTICLGSPANLTASGGDGTYTWNADPNLNTTSGANVIATPPAVGTYNYTVNSATGNPLCPASTSATATVTVSSCTSCTITSMPITMTTCNNSLPTLSYDVSGTVNFTTPPATGTLTISDCNGGSQVFNAPFGTSQAFTFTALPHTGTNCAFTAVFSDDAACTITTNFLAPSPITLFNMTTGACASNQFNLTGDITFSSPPTTGTLVVSVDYNGTTYDTIINPPFSSPEPWSISSLPTGNGAFTVTYYWSNFPSCTQVINGTAPADCSVPCTADIGTFNSSITPNNGQALYKLCFGDVFDLTSNGDFVPPADISSATTSYNPGIGYLIYSCPPTIGTVPSNTAPNDNITNDPCFIGVAGVGNNFNDVNFLGAPSYAGTWTNNTIYYVPLTFYDTIGFTYSNVNIGDLPCYEMGQPFAVEYLSEITFTETPDCQDSSVTFTIQGGLPKSDGSLFTGSNLSPAYANFANNTATHNGTITISGLHNGDMYSFDVVDANGCPITISSGPFVGLPDPNAGVADTTCTLTYNLNAIPSYGTGAWSGPAGISFSATSSATTTVTSTTAGTFTLTWTEDNGSGCTASNTVDITFNILSIPNTLTDPTCFNGNNGEILLAPQGGATPYSYQWDAAASNQITNPATNLSAGSYTVTVSDNFGCTLDSTFTLSEPTPFSYTTASQNANCGQADGWITVLGFTGGTGTFTYDWGAGTTTNDTLFNLAPNTYTVTVADINGCDTIFDITVGNNSPFTATIISSTNVSCFGLSDGTATADGSIASATYSYLWDAAAGNQITQTASNLAVGTYAVTLTDILTGCTDDTTITITEPLPVVTEAGSNDTSCTLTYNLNAQTSFGTGSWSASTTGNFSNNTSATSNVTVPAAGIYTFYWTETSAATCNHTDSVKITFKVMDIPNTITNPTCFNGNNGQIILAPQGGFSPYAYQWNAAANNQITNPANNLSAGNYTVTVSDNFGCTLDSTFTLTEPTPFSYTTAAQNANCGQADGWVTVLGFTGGTGIFTYDWGSGITSNDTLFNLTPNTYTVTVADVNGCDTIFDITVGNNSPFTATITTSTNVSCFGANDGQATADGSDPAATYTYLWDAAANNQATQTAINLSAGTYSVTVTDVNSGCTDDTTITITQPTKVDNAANDINICFGQSANLTANASNGNGGPYTYFWDNGAFVGSPYNVSPTNTTIYTVYAESSPNNCSSDTINVTVNVSPMLAVVASPDQNICLGDQATINATATVGSGNGGPYTFTWSNAVLTASQNVSPLITTTYIITLTDGCSTLAYDTVVVTINPIPVIDFSVDTLKLCESPAQVFTFFTDTTGGMFSDILWDFGDGATSSLDTIAHTYSQPGSYDITLSLTSSANTGSCSASLTKNNYVTVNTNPTADFNATPNPATIFDPIIHFEDESYTNINFWKWNFGGLDSSIVQHPTYTFPQDTGNYAISLMVTDNNGCTNSITKIVTVKGEYAVYVPNAFSPDSDNLNDGFSPVGFGVSDKGYSFFIYDRWGELIFETHTKFKAWNGTFENKLVPNDVYIWKLHYVDIDNNKHSEMGKVSLIK